MEQILMTELVKNSDALLKKGSDFSPSYQEAMKNALVKFASLGIPSKSNEDWKYTNIAKNLSPRFYEQKESIIHDLPSVVLDKRAMIIFNNGVYNKFQSKLPDGIELDALMIEDNFFDSFDSLNFGVALSPLSLKIKKNITLDFPITIVHLTDDTAVNKMVSPRLYITAGENSKVSFLEIFQSLGNEKLQYSTNSVTIFKLLANSQVEHVKIQKEASNAVHIGLTDAKIFKDATFKSMTLDFGLLTSRHNINVGLMESGAASSVHGLFALKNSEHSDIFSNITHFAPHTTSDQLFKGILTGDSHGVFTGKIIIKKDAQQSASSQLNKNLLLSKIAHIDTRPQLLVHADDVKCSHGATVGQLSKEEEFYLESRGIPKEHAKRMLCRGFAVDVIIKIENQKIKAYAESLLSEVQFI